MAEHPAETTPAHDATEAFRADVEDVLTQRDLRDIGLDEAIELVVTSFVKHRIRPATAREPLRGEETVVATLLTPLPIGAMTHLIDDLTLLYGDGLVMLPFERGEHARIVKP